MRLPVLSYGEEMFNIIEHNAFYENNQLVDLSANKISRP